MPLDDRWAELFGSELAGRPVLIRGKSQLLFSSTGCLGENVVRKLKNQSHAVTAEVVLPDGQHRP